MMKGMLLNTIIHYVLFYQIFDIVTESDSDEVILEEGKWTFSFRMGICDWICDGQATLVITAYCMTF